MKNAFQSCLISGLSFSLHHDARSNVNILVLKTRSLLGVTSTLEMEPTPSPRWDTGTSLFFPGVYHEYQLYFGLRYMINFEGVMEGQT